MKEKILPIALSASISFGACSQTEQTIKNDDSFYEDVVDEYRNFAEDTETLIPSIDQSVKNLYNTLSTKLSQDGLDEKQSLEILSPVKLYLDNIQTNPTRNVSQLIVDYAEQGAESVDDLNAAAFELAGQLSAENFYLACEPDPLARSNLSASYARVLKTVLLACDYDLLSKYDAIVLYHELIHVQQDKFILDSGNAQTYFDLERDGFLVINFEIEAYARELELLDILSDGQLKRSVKRGDRASDISKMLTEKLAAPESDEFWFKQIGKFAQAYFGKSEKGFTNHVALQYLSQGQRVVEIMDDGAIIELNLNQE